jgi:hypothetical protein
LGIVKEKKMYRKEKKEKNPREKIKKMQCFSKSYTTDWLILFKTMLDAKKKGGQKFKFIAISG